MQRWKERLESIGEVTVFDFDYMREGRKRPDPPPLLIAAHRRALAQLRAKTSGQIFLIGKSMGGRIGCHVSLEEEIAGLICLGYPLCGMGDPTKLRDKVLRELQTPILFIQGTRDPLCPLALLDQVRSEMKALNELYILEDGDHSLRVPLKLLKSRGETQESIDQRILHAIERFSASNLH